MLESVVAERVRNETTSVKAHGVAPMDEEATAAYETRLLVAVRAANQAGTTWANIDELIEWMIHLNK